MPEPSGFLTRVMDMCMAKSDGRAATQMDYLLPDEHPTDMSIPDYQNVAIPLQSPPGADVVTYLDFDGEPGPHDGWSGVGDAAPSGGFFRLVKGSAPGQGSTP